MAEMDLSSLVEAVHGAPESRLRDRFEAASRSGLVLLALLRGQRCISALPQRGSQRSISAGDVPSILSTAAGGPTPSAVNARRLPPNPIHPSLSLPASRSSQPAS